MINKRVDKVKRKSIKIKIAMRMKFFQRMSPKFVKTSSNLMKR
jgi:hypothetical protein